MSSYQISKLSSDRQDAKLTPTELREKLRKLTDIYQFRDPGITDFLTEHSYLINVLLEAYPQVERFFGKASKVTLALMIDPEIVGLQELFAYIHTNLSVDKALERLDELDEQWYLAQMEKTQGHFNFSLEFV